LFRPSDYNWVDSVLAGKCEQEDEVNDKRGRQKKMIKNRAKDE